MSKKFLLINTLLLFLVSSCFQIHENTKPVILPTKTNTPQIVTLTPTAIPEPERTTRTYTISEETILNPERGFSSEAELTDTDFNEYYEDGVTLVYLTIRLDDYRDSDIPQSLLTEMKNFFSAMRPSGIKASIRFAYNDGPYPNPEPDASLEQILKHIHQLAPTLKENADVIVWFEAGFIGAWGEWHTSTNYLDEDVEAKRQILFALLDATPSDRAVLLRYPVDLITFFPTPLTDSDVENKTIQTRVGFHNDCFLASSDDEHTFARDGIFNYEDELSYLYQSTQFIPVGGESCAYNPPRSDCPTALAELAFFHYTDLGDGWHPDVLESWEAQGCYAEIEDRLGYRLSLIETTVNQKVKPGGIINLQVKINNDGFAPPINSRPVYLVLDGSSRYETLLPVNPRLWLSGEESIIEVQVRLPATIAEGEYKLALWLPDSYLSLSDNPRYSIQFANESVWDAVNAYNVLQDITVTTLALGEVDLDATSFEVINK
jgi:hypothetical protein